MSSQGPTVRVFINDFIKKTLDDYLHKNPDISELLLKRVQLSEKERKDMAGIKKLANKNIDYIVLNYANEDGAGFESNTNHVYLYSKSGEKKEFSLNRKDKIAQLIIDNII